jgi:putative sterol carrier protein
MSRLAKLRDFSGEDLRASLEKVAAELPRGSMSGKLAVVVTEVERRVLLLDIGHSEVEEWPASRGSMPSAPDFIVFAKLDTLRAVLRGELSPLEALLAGRLRYSGSTGLGIAILRQLASTQDAVFEPCRDTGAPHAN